MHCTLGNTPTLPNTNYEALIMDTIYLYYFELFVLFRDLTSYYMVYLILRKLNTHDSSNGLPYPVRTSCSILFQLFYG